MLTWLADLFGPLITYLGVPQPQRYVMDFEGAGVSVADNPTKRCTTITIAGADAFGDVDADPNTLAERDSTGQIRATSFATPALLGNANNGALRLPQAGTTGSPVAQVAVAMKGQSSTAVQLLGASTPSTVQIGDGNEITTIDAQSADIENVNDATLEGTIVVTPSAATLTGTSYRVDFRAMGSNPDLTLTANATLLSPSNVIAGGRYVITTRQSGGAWSIAWDSHFVFGKYSSQPTAAANAVDYFEFIGDASGTLRCVGATTVSQTDTIRVTGTVKTFSGTGTESVRIFQVTGQVLVKAIWGQVTTTLGNHTAYGVQVDDGTVQTPLNTGNSGAASAMPPGSLLGIIVNGGGFPGSVAGAFTAAQGNQLNEAFVSGNAVIIQKTGNVATYLAWFFSTSDSPNTTGAAQFFVDYVPLTPGATITAV